MHRADNHILTQSKMAKVLSLLDLLRLNCQEFGTFYQLLSIDESMIPYRGLNSVNCKRIHKKEVSKIWLQVINVAAMVISTVSKSTVKKS